MSAVSTIRNLGPALEAAYARAGILSAEEIHALGADDAYAALLRSGHRAHFMGYIALTMGLQGRPWNDCSDAEKAALRADFDRLCAKVRGDDSAAPEGIEAILDQLGTGKRR